MKTMEDVFKNFKLEFDPEMIKENMTIDLKDKGGHRITCPASFFLPSILTSCLRDTVDSLIIVLDDDNVMNIKGIFIEISDFANVDIKHLLSEDCISRVRQEIIRRRLDAVKAKAQASGS